MEISINLEDVYMTISYRWVQVIGWLEKRLAWTAEKGAWRVKIQHIKYEHGILRAEG